MIENLPHNTSLSTDPKLAVRALIELGNWANSRHWCPATGGNFSHRLSQDEMYISRSGCHIGALSEEDFLKINVFQAPPPQPQTIKQRPSAETQLHQAIYALEPKAQVVLHTHSVNSTVLSRVIEGEWLRLSGFEMQKSLTGNQTHDAQIRIAILDNHQNMHLLAQALTARWRQQPLSWGFLVRGHGLYCWGNNPDNTKQHLEGLEFLFSCALEMLKLGALK